MKKNRMGILYPREKVKKLLIMTKFCLLFVILSFQLQANIYSQKRINLELKSVSLRQVFLEIEKNTEFSFCYNRTQIGKYNEIDVSLRNATIEKVLDYCLKNTTLKYKIIQKHVLVSKKIVLDKKVNKKTIKGKVVDDKGNPLIGASVIVKGTNCGVTTNADGVFTLDVPTNDLKLEVSFIGYKTKVVDFRKLKDNIIRLEEDRLMMDEVIAIGYGSSKKKDLTGSVSRIDSKLIERTGFTHIGQIIEGAASGVEVLRGDGPSGKTKIKIRGDATLVGVDPLIVVDNFSMDEEFDIETIDVNTIKNIDILKGASACAIYGSRAAGGVVVITTKMGMTGTKPSINVSYKLGIKDLSSKVDVLTTDELKYLYFTTGIQTAINRGETFESLLGAGTYDNIISNGYWGDNNYDWADEVCQKAKEKDISINLSGGGQKSRYYASLGLVKEEGILVGAERNRLNGSFRFNTKMSRNIDYSLSLRLNKSNSGTHASYSEIYSTRPDWKPYNEDGTPYRPIRDNGTTGITYENTPLTSALNSDPDNEDLGINISNELSIKFNDKLRFESSYSYSWSHNYSYSYRNMEYATDSYYAKGNLNVSENRRHDISFDNKLFYTNNFGNHKFDVVLGQAFKHRYSFRYSFSRTNFPTDKQKAIWQASDDVEANKFNGDQNASNILSFFYRINYKYKNILITNSLRRDQSSRFSQNNSSAYFPSVALGWIISDYDFWKNRVPWISLFKFRASLGTSGNDYVGEFAWRNQFVPRKYNDSGCSYIYRLGNENLKWETVSQKDISLDFALFKNSRIRGTINYYEKSTKDILFRQKLPLSVGVRNDVYVNLANVDNKGIELELKTDLIRTKNINWGMSLNIARNTNKVTNINGEISSIENDYKADYIVREGEPLGRFYGFITDGIFKTKEELEAYQSLHDSEYISGWSVGDYKIVDLDGDGIITGDDKTVLGQSNPDFHGGLNTNFSYKQFTISIQSSFSVGAQRYWKACANMLEMQTTPRNKMNFILNAWTPTNTNTEYPGIKFKNGGDYVVKTALKDVYVYDASFFKISSISLGYSVPRNLLKKIKLIKSCKFDFYVNEVYTFTDYPGLNPQGYPSSSLQNISVDYSSYPKERTYKLGCSISF